MMDAVAPRDHIFMTHQSWISPLTGTAEYVTMIPGMFDLEKQ